MTTEKKRASFEEVTRLLLTHFSIEDIVREISKPDATEADKEKIRQYLLSINTLH